MKAIQVLGAYQATVAEVPDPVLAPGQALVKIRAMGICGTDVATYKAINVNVKSYPIIIGHEIAGEIAEIDENNEYGFKKGDKVVLDPYMFCGHCYPCEQGRTNCCEDMHCLGVHCTGAMSEYFAHPISMLRKIPQDMPWEMAAVAEPLVISMHGVHTVGVKPGEHMAVIGAGAIGLLAAMGCKAYGGIPILIDPVQERLDMAKEWGIDHVINPATQDAVAEISKLTNGRMAECVMEASGSIPGVKNTLDYAAYTGRIALTGWPKGPVELPTNLITKKELTVRGSRNGAGEFEECIDLIYSGRVPAQKIITRVVDFEELPQALDDLAKRPGDFLKVVGLIKD